MVPTMKSFPPVLLLPFVLFGVVFILPALLAISVYLTKTPALLVLSVDFNLGIFFGTKYSFGGKTIRLSLDKRNILKALMGLNRRIHECVPNWSIWPHLHLTIVLEVFPLQTAMVTSIPTITSTWPKMYTALKDLVSLPLLFCVAARRWLSDTFFGTRCHRSAFSRRL